MFLSDLQRFELAIQLKETENIDNFTSDNMNIWADSGYLEWDRMDMAEKFRNLQNFANR